VELTSWQYHIGSLEDMMKNYFEMMCWAGFLGTWRRDGNVKRDRLVLRFVRSCQVPTDAMTWAIHLAIKGDALVALQSLPSEYP
jgi:hypothetical protein